MSQPRWQGGEGLAAITFDFGNSLVPFPAELLRGVATLMAERAAPRFGATGEAMLAIWGDERERQLREDVPQGREADMDVRVTRVLARLRGAVAPPEDECWDDALAASYSTPREIEEVLDEYASTFVEITPVTPGIEELLARLATRYRLAVLSNWPLGDAVDRYLEHAGWRRHLTAVTGSQRARCIKPCPEIFHQTAAALAVESGPAILHVGDDLGADVAGARGVGWHAAWIRVTPEDSTLPTAPVPESAVPDFELDSVADLPAALSLR